MNKNTQLIEDLTSFDVSNIILLKPEVNEIKNQPGLTYTRVRLAVKNPDGSIGDFVVKTKKLFSFGVQDNTPPNGKPYYSIPLCMWGLNGPENGEKEWVDSYNSVIEQIKTLLVESRDDFDKYDLEMSDLKKFNPMYYKRDKGKIVEDAAPRLYPKLMESPKAGVMTIFTDSSSGEDIDVSTAKQQKCLVESAILIESVFVGNKLSLQQKVLECEVEFQESTKKRLLRPSAKPREVSLPKPQVTRETEEEVDEEEDVGEEDGGSLGESDAEEEEEVKPPTPPPKVEEPKKKRVVRKKAASGN